MYTARIEFSHEGRAVEDVTDFAIDVLSCLYKNGQVIRWSLASTAATVDASRTAIGGVSLPAGAIASLSAFVKIPDGSALDPSSHGEYVVAALEAGRAKGYSPPSIEVLGRDPSEPDTCSCRERQALLLFTHYLSDLPPVRCLGCNLAVPLYRLPYIHDKEHLVILQWAADYVACNTLQMHCTTGERFGEAQLAHHDSSLSKNGRALCRDLELAVGIPVFYYLHKTRGRSASSEAARRCPSCGGGWRLPSPLHHFDLRCDSCRLLGAMAASLRK